MNIDEVFTRTGEFGSFQRKAVAVYCFSMLFLGSQMIQNVFTGGMPEKKDLTCIDTEFKPCSEECTETNYPVDAYHTYAFDWDLACSPTTVESTQSIFMAGVLVGSFLISGLADKYGRLPVVIVCNTFSAVFSTASGFSQGWTIYVVLRFCTGFCLAGVIIVGFVLASELVGPSKRNIVATLPALFFAIGIALLSAVAKLTNDWKSTAIITGLVGFIFTPAYWWFLCESPRWYLSKNNIEKCKQILKRIAAINGQELDSFNLQYDEPDDTNTASMLSLFTNRILLKLTLIQIFIWFTNSVVYYGLTIAAGSMGGDRYISVTLSAMVEIPSNIIVIVLMNHPRLGRVKTCALAMLISSICCGAIMIIPAAQDEKSSLSVMLAVSGKFFIVFSFAVIYAQAAELYPTPVRNVAIGLLSAANRIGGVLAPQLVNLAHLPSAPSHNIHFLVFSILGIVSGVLCYMLPETLGRPLPNTVDDIYSGVKKVDKTVHHIPADKVKLLEAESI